MKNEVISIETVACGAYSMTIKDSNGYTLNTNTNLNCSKNYK